jgi:predicted DNA-binding ribbon-helix-helix protein
METGAEESNDKVTGEARLRLLTLSGRRRAFKLEPSFWQALEHMAQHRRERLSNLVVRLLGDDGGNATARLRVAAVDWFMREAQAGASRDLKARWQRIIDLMIEPVFIIDQHKQILLFNGPMRTFVASLGVQSQLRLGLAAEIGRILALFEENEQRLLSLPCSLEADQRSFKATVRMTMLERARGQTLLLCALRQSPPSA